MFTVSNKSESLYRRVPESVTAEIKRAVRAAGGKVRCAPESGGEVCFCVTVTFARHPGWATNAEAHGRAMQAVPRAALYRDRS